MKNVIKTTQVIVIIVAGIIGYTAYHNNIMVYRIESMQKSIHDDLSYCDLFIKREIKFLQYLCTTWAQRGDIQSLATVANSTRNAKLINTIHSATPIHFLALTGPSGKTTYLEQRDKDGNDFIITRLTVSGEQPVSGLLKGNRDVYMVAVSPIAAGADNTAAGKLIFARRIDTDFVESLQAYTGSDISCALMAGEEANKVVTAVNKHLPAGTQVSSINRQSKTVSGAVNFADIYGNNVLTISASQQDFFLHRMRAAGWWLLVVIAMVTAVNFMLARTLSGKSIRRLCARIKSMKKTESSPIISTYCIDLDQISASRSTNSENLQQKEQFVRLQNKILFDLVRMNTFSDESFSSLVNRITESTAEFLEVDRVCIWVFNETFTTINLFDLYNHRLNIHSNGDVVEAEKFPTFFQALQDGTHISVKDVSKDPRLKDFFEHYLSPEGISSVLDVPISFGDKIRGVLCHEHMGPMRDWTRYEERYASSIADLISLIFDKFEHKKMEDDYNKTKQIESIGLIAGGIGHDFNNLLTAILGNCTLAMMSCQPDSQQLEFLENIEKATNRARDLSQQLLNFSREGTPVKKNASILEVIRESANFSLKGSNVRCVINAPDGLWNVLIDKGQISQVINNLIINANHAMPDGGTVTVTCENISLKTQQISSLASGKYVRISIQDHGIGISPENQKKIFEPYFTTKEKGSGLGLATCYSIMKKHKGHISVQSEPGIGSVFSIYLPASETKENLLAANNDTGIKMGNGTILIMDDDEMVRSVLGQTISSFGYSILYARDGNETLDIIRESIDNNRCIDAVIMDLTIPGGMGGKKTIRQLKEIAPSIKAFVSSGYSNDPIMNEFDKYGFSGVIAKPVDIQSLNTILHSVLSAKA